MEQKIPLTKNVWTSFLLMFLGLWLIASPLTFGYKEFLGKNDVICGFILLICGWKSRHAGSVFAPWLACAIGLWLQLAPIFFWAANAAAYLNETFTGILAIVFSVILPGIPGHKERKGPEIPPGWSYNPSSWPQRIPVIALACFGWLAARYLASYQLGFIERIWDPWFVSSGGLNGSECVLTSAISQSFPVSDAGMGAFAYSLEAILGCKGGTARWRTMPWLVLSFGLLVIPLGLISIFLIILQPLAVGCWCALCLMIAFAMLLMVMLTIDEVMATLHGLHLARSKGLSWMEALWQGLPETAAISDDKTPPLSSSFNTLLSTAFLGCSFRWNLLCTALLGAVAMMLPAYLSMPKIFANWDHVLGALCIVLSVVSMANATHKARFGLALFGCILIVLAFTQISEPKLFFPHLVLGGSWLALCFKH